MSEMGTPGKRKRFIEKCELEAELMYPPSESKSAVRWRLIDDNKELRRKANAYDELMKSV
jgi:hypothetical protein